MATDYDDADLIRTCTRKKGYPSESVARLAITSIREVNPEARVRPYACRRCGQWHVGNSPDQRPMPGYQAPPRASGTVVKMRRFADGRSKRVRVKRRQRYDPYEE